MNAESNESNLVATYGQAIERRMIEDLRLEQIDRFEALLDLRNLKGDSTGYVKTLNAERIDRASSVSIDIAPGMRYFNIHIIPDHHYEVPRFSFEGMLAPHGHQVSMDLYPDYDVLENLDKFYEMYADIDVLFDKARKSDGLPLEFSRLPHMRAIASPYFALVPKATPEQMSVLEKLANGYFDAWLKIFRSAPKLSDDDAATKLRLRNLISRTIVERDPDRNMVVQVYGEETTQAIESAAMP